MTGKIPQTFIDEVLARVDIVDIIDSRVPLSKMGKDFKARCPFHDEKTPSFTVSQAKQFYHCFGCGQSGTAITFLMEFGNLSFPEAIEELASQAGLEVPTEPGQPRSTTAPNQTKELLTVLSDANRYYQRQLREHADAQTAIDYLKQRGLSGEIAASFNLGFAPDSWDGLLRSIGTSDDKQKSMATTGLLIRKDKGGYYDRFRGRIIFPIEDHRGRVVGFGGRVLGDGEPKYLNSPETPLFHKGGELYGLYRARKSIRDSQHSIVVEGYMDVVALAQSGVDNAVATLGTATTAAHLERLFRLAPEIVFCFDGDRAGHDAAWRALEVALPALRDGFQIGFLFLEDGEDPDSTVRAEGADAFRERIKNAMPLPDFFFKHLTAQTDLRRPDGRARLFQLCNPLIEKLPNGVLRKSMEERLATKARINTDDLSDVRSQLPQSNISQRTRPLKPARPTTLSPVAQAMVLLLQHPRETRGRGDVEKLAGLDQAGVDLLIELIDLIDTEPELNTAGLLERFRHSPHHTHLEKLAAWNHLVPDDNVVEAFDQILHKLIDKRLGQEIKELLAKSEQSTLSKPDKQRLSELIRQRKLLGKL